MTIYIEAFILQNAIINFCLLRLVGITSQTSTKTYKQITSSLIGAGFSVLTAMFIDNYLVVNFIKLACAFCMILIAFNATKKQFLFNFILLFIYTYAMYGVVQNLSACTFYTNFGCVTTGKFNLTYICISIIVFTYIFELVAKHLKPNLKSNLWTYNIKLSLGCNNIQTTAFLDSGNMLNYNGKPVMILDINIYLKLSNKTLLEFLLEKSYTISTGTIAGSNSLKLLQIDKLEISYKNKKINIEKPYVAIDNNNSFLNRKYQALISPNMV